MSSTARSKPFHRAYAEDADGMHGTMRYYKQLQYNRSTVLSVEFQFDLHVVRNETTVFNASPMHACHKRSNGHPDSRLQRMFSIVLVSSTKVPVRPRLLSSLVSNIGPSTIFHLQ
jgi:hypothetical protein